MADPVYVTRAEVGLVPPRSLRPLRTPVDHLFIHHTVTAGINGAREWLAVQRYHMGTRGYADIAYHAGITPDAAVLEGRPPKMMGGATLDWNQKSLAICFIGDYSTLPASAAQLASAAWTARLWILMGLLDPAFAIHGHRDESTSECPGDALYAQIPDIHRLIVAPAAAPTPTTLLEGDEEMPYLMLKDTRDGTIWALFPGGRVRHIGGGEFSSYDAHKVPLRDCVVTGESDPHAEANRLKSLVG